MSDVQVLVDFENVQPSFEELVRLAPGLSSLWLFHGPHQTKLAQQFKAEHEHVTLVPISKTGKNALDFHLSFYLGYVAARHPDATLVVVANDKGYDPMILHASTLGFDARRVDTKVKAQRAALRPRVAKSAGSATPAKKAPARKPTAKAKAKPAAVQAPAARPDKAAPASKPATPRTQPAAKKVAKPVPVAKTPTAKQPSAGGRPQAAKAASAKSASAKAVPAKAALEKVTPVKVPVKKATSPRPKAGGPTAATLARVSAGLAKMGARRPEKLKSLLRHLASMLGPDATADEVQDLVHRLAQAGVIRVSVDGVSYRDG